MHVEHVGERSLPTALLFKLMRLRARTSTTWAEVSVREVFKGPLKAGETLTLPAGGAGDCTLPFAEGEDWLVYSSDSAPEWAMACTRTHRAPPDDVDLKWLRTGEIPAEAQRNVEYIDWPQDAGPTPAPLFACENASPARKATCSLPLICPHSEEDGGSVGFQTMVGAKSIFRVPIAH